MSKATIVKGNKVVATADSVKEAQAYAKKVGGKVLVPASNPPARKNGSAQWTRAQVVDQIRKNIAAMSDSIEPDYTGIADLRRLAKLVAAKDNSITWDRTHWRNGLDGVKLIEDGNAIYALRGYPAGSARKNGAKTADSKVISAFLDHLSANSKKLSTDGRRLDGNWMGGDNIARWGSDDKIHFEDLGSRAAQTYQRAIVRAAPKNWIAK